MTTRIEHSNFSAISGRDADPRTLGTHGFWRFRLLLVAAIVGVVTMAGLSAISAPLASATGSLLGSPISVGVNPVAIAVSGNHAYVVNKGIAAVPDVSPASGASLSVINIDTNSVESTVDLAGVIDEPSSIAVGGGFIYVSSYAGALKKIDASSFAITTLSGAWAIRALAYSPLNKLVLAMEQGATIINLADLTRTRVYLDYDAGLAAIAVGDYAYVATNGRIWKLNLAGTMSVYPDPNSAAALVWGYVSGVAADGTSAWVAPASAENGGAVAVAVVSMSNATPSVTHLTPVAGSPGRIAIANGRAYVTNTDVSQLTVIDTTSFDVSSRDIGFIAVDIAVSGDYGYLVNPAGTVSVISLLAPPAVTSIDPISGGTAGGTRITITGAGFSPDATVTVGGAACSAVTFTSSTSLSCSTPSGNSGVANVVVSNPDAQIATLVGAFTYTGGGGSGGGSGGQPNPAPAVTTTPAPTPTPSVSPSVMPSVKPAVTPSSSPSASVPTPAGVVVLSGSERTNAQIVTVSAPVATSPVYAPQITVAPGVPIAPVVVGLPSRTQLLAGMSVAPLMRAKNSYVPIGVTRSSASGRAKVPAFKASRAGIYTIRLTTPAGKAFYLKVKVAAKKASGASAKAAR
jgi:hypothetical protein